MIDFDTLHATLQAEFALRKPEDMDDYIARFAAQFRAFGVDRLEITFYGGGDEGSIDGIAVAGTALEGPLFGLIETWAYDYLETKDVDWYNNDGGSGSITFDLANSNFSVEINVNETVSSLALAEEFAI